MSVRTISGERNTGETKIKLSLNIDGNGELQADTGIPFFEHMLSHLCKHGGIDMNLTLKGDLQIDAHHSVEDSAILTGQLLDKLLADRKGIERYGHFTLPMDDALVVATLDLGGRFFFNYRGVDLVPMGKFNNYDSELTLEFMQKFAMYARMNLHIHVLDGSNRHHIHEGMFKAVGRSLRMALALNPRMEGKVPSTKGVL